jgi:PhzF family phenazine biosynthesis protein
MRQSETVFLSDVTPQSATARVFTVEEELGIAGHPVLGAAAVLHRELWRQEMVREWQLRLAANSFGVRTEVRGAAVLAEMDQGLAEFGEPLAVLQCAAILTSLGLVQRDLDPRLPLQVVSTGLPYLIVPVSPDALARAAIRGDDFKAQLSAVGAKFAFVLDASAPELRTWDNLGRVEDAATGSAAGPAGAYLVRHGLSPAGPALRIAQGRFAGRPSELQVRVDAGGRVRVSGEVWPVARGELEF